MPLSRKTRSRPLASSRLTSKGQATFPVTVRKTLHLKPGDTILFEASETGRVFVRKAEALDLEFLAALESTLSEWNSKNDDRAYRDL